MKRRQFIQASTSAVLLAKQARLFAAEKPQKAPFRVLFSNDTTNTTTCTSPWHEKGVPFRPQMLEATVDEVAGLGVDVHLLQPGFGWAPWWNSKILPNAERYRWLEATYGLKPGSFDKYLLAGGDIVQLFINRCRLRGQAPFVSYRLNDSHHLELADAKPGDKIPGGAAQTLTKFYRDHPDYRLAPDLKNWNTRVHNWAIPEVRAYKFALIQELCENYDLDGLELDFLRHCSFFRQDETTTEQRRAIMTGFVRQVRAVLDRTAKAGRHRWLCVRVPCFLAPHDALGIDVAAFAAAGVEMFNLSPYYVTEQQTDVAAIAKLIPGAAAYVEMTHTTRVGPKAGPATGYDDFTFRRTTDEQFYTTAHLAYARGLQSASLFNFVYYREHGTPFRGPFHEPPFHVLSHLGDPAWLARQPQHYFITRGYDTPPVPSRQMGNKEPRTVKNGEPARFTLDMAPPAGGWKSEGRLRLESPNPLANSRLSVKFNGMLLTPTDDVSEPYPNPYPSLLGTPETLRAWQVPSKILRDGVNEIEVTLESGEPVSFVFLDLAVG